MAEFSEHWITDEESAWRFVDHLVADKDYKPDITSFDVANWPVIDIYIAGAEPSGSVTAPMLETAIQIQKSVYRLAAFVKYGEANGHLLTDKDRADFEIRFVVVPGSSDLKAYLKDAFPAFLESAMEKMTGRQIAIVLVLLGLIASGTYSWTYYLDHTLAVKQAELDGEKATIAAKEKAALIDLASDAVELSKYKMEQINELSEEAPETKKAQEAASEIQDHVIRGVDSIGGARVAGVEITEDAASVIRKNLRRKSTKVTVEQEYIVAKIDRTHPDVIKVVLEDPQNGDQISVPFADPLIKDEFLTMVGAAAGIRGRVLATIRAQRFGDELRGQELVKVTEPEPDTDRSNPSG